MRPTLRSMLTLLTVTALSSCGGTEDPPSPSAALAFNEVVSNNEGVYVDEFGELDDWIELVNTSDTSINLSDYAITDSSSPQIPLPNITLKPGAYTVLMADDSPEQGDQHLPFKISSGGETLTLYNQKQEVIDTLKVPALTDNQAYARFPSASGAFQICRYTSANKNNGTECQSNTAPTVEDAVTFLPFDKTQWPNSVVPKSLAINKLALLPAGFIEIKNFGQSPLDLDDFALTLSALSPTQAYPTFAQSTLINLPSITLPANATAAVPLTAAQVEPIELQAFNEGVAVLFERAQQQAVDTVPFMHWPTDSALTRSASAPFNFRFCTHPSQDLQNTCQPLVSRTLGDRTRGLYTPADFATLAGGSGLANIESVKFIMDIQLNNAVHYLSAERWPLHYTFVREVIELKPHLDRCDAFESQQFSAGWSQFSAENYFTSTARRYHLGTLSNHANAKLNAVEFTFGDRITAAQIRDAFFAATAKTSAPYDWFLRPQDTEQIAKARTIESTLPIVGTNAPFQNITQQTLAAGVAYGFLHYLDVGELESVPLGPRAIVITNDVPNDIDFVGGLITEAFQTPLAHVNILSQGRGTPNLALPNAHNHPEIKPLIGKLVRFEVTAGGFSVALADPKEAEVFWATNTENTTPLVPRLDVNTKALTDLTQVGIESLPAIGAKAAQIAELFKVSNFGSQCNAGNSFAVPEKAFAIPMHHYLTHFEASGAQAFLATVRADPLFTSDIAYRRLSLSTLQQMMLQHPVAPALLSQVESWVQTRFGNKRVRFRSSSNTEDLATFNGAGLYTSISAELDDDSRRVDDAIRTVWASLWNFRAYEERSFANVDQTRVAMGVLVHLAFRNERANGVAIARNILNPSRSDQYYVNSQAGEASVTNPAPGIITEQLVYQWPPRTPRLTYHSHSSLTNSPVITAAEVQVLACAMSAIQNHFRPLLDPLEEDRWFTMESEFKFLGETRQFLIKQARPYPFDHLNIKNDCREIE